MTNTRKLLRHWAVLACLATWTACGGGGSSSPPTTNDSIVATSSTTSTINVVVGSSTPFSVTFTTDDGKTATNLSITTGLATLPAGWTGPTSFTCASVGTGSGCMLNLTYHPTAAGSGTVTLSYSYTNDAGTSKSGTATATYKATSNDNVVAASSPAGQIAAITGSTNAVGVTFTTDDSQTATNFNITSGLSSLPAGWSGPTTFTCASVSTGSGCMLNLTYHPTAAGSGSLTVDYSYTDNAGTAKTGTANISYTATSQDNVTATTSPAGQIAVLTGITSAVGITFNTDDGALAKNLSITAGLTTLPAGWTGPATFTCASVSTGGGCALNLSYHPTAAGSGTVTLNYSYTNDAGTAKTGTAVVSYAATSQDNVVTTTSPVGQIAVITGGTSTVGITFTTDDGARAANLVVTPANLTSLPAGWTGPATFTCATVSTGSGCLLDLTYAPTAIASGSITLNYAYTNNAGTAKTGSVTLSYVATTQNHVVATQSPAGQIVAVLGGSQTVHVNFTTDDSNPATNLSVTPANLTSLPAGWTGPATFTCATLSTGNGCQLSLTYTPTVTGTGTVTLNFGYTNNSGVALTGSVNIAYAATVNNSVIGTPAPSGTVTAVVNQGSQLVTVTFNSNDGNPASNVAITGGLTTLPSGWSGPSTFTCASVHPTGNTCQLSLTYAPSAYAPGTLQLNYSYNSNSGAAGSGSVTIPYTATTHDTLVATQSPSGTIGAVVNGASVPVTLTFTTSDGNPATAITITSGLGTLPPGWSGPATFTCASASTGSGCQLTLTYAPTASGNGTVALGLSYNDDAGTAQTGTANITYASIPPLLYLTDNVSNVVSCTMNADGSLSACANATTGLSAPTGIAFSGKWAYVAPGIAATDVDVCPVNANGTFGTCTPAIAPTSPFSSPNALAVSGGYLYVTDANGPNVYNCPINADGSLGTCASTDIGTVNTPDGIAIAGNTAYIVDVNGANLTTCTVSGTDGTLSACTQIPLDNSAPGGGNTPTAAPRSAAVYNGNLYIGTTAGDMILTIAGNGSVTVNYPCSTATGTSCTIDGNLLTPPVQTPLAGFAFNVNYGFAYVAGTGGAGGVGICTIEATGVLDNCTTSPNAFLNGVYGGIAVH